MSFLKLSTDTFCAEEYQRLNFPEGQYAILDVLTTGHHLFVYCLHIRTNSKTLMHKNLDSTSTGTFDYIALPEAIVSHITRYYMFFKNFRSPNLQVRVGHCS
jgi:hypothetical protein